jgi:hypothetical protein
VNPREGGRDLGWDASMEASSGGRDGTGGGLGFGWRRGGSGEAGGGEAARGLGSEERDGETAGRQAAATRRPSRQQAMGERERERERAEGDGERERAAGARVRPHFILRKHDRSHQIVDQRPQIIGPFGPNRPCFIHSPLNIFLFLFLFLFIAPL